MKNIKISLAMILSLFVMITAPPAGAEVVYKSSLHALANDSDGARYEYPSGTTRPVDVSVKRLSDTKLQVSFAVPVETVVEYPFRGGDGVSAYFHVMNNFWFRTSDKKDIAATGVNMPSFGAHIISGDKRTVFKNFELTFDEGIPAGAVLNFTASLGSSVTEVSRASLAVPGAALVASFERPVEENIPKLKSLSVVSTVDGTDKMSVYSGGIDLQTQTTIEPQSVLPGENVVITAAADDGCRVLYNGAEQKGGFIPNLTEGINIIELTVAEKKEGGGSLTYTLYIIKEQAEVRLSELLMRLQRETPEGSPEEYEDPQTIKIGYGSFYEILPTAPFSSKHVKVKPLPENANGTSITAVRYGMMRNQTGNPISWTEVDVTSHDEEGYYTIPLTVGENFIGVDIKDAAGHSAGYTFSMRFLDDQPFMTKLELWREYKIPGGKIREKLDFDKAFTGAPQPGLVGSERDTYRVPSLTEKSVGGMDDLILVIDTNPGTDIEIDGKRYYESGKANNESECFEVRLPSKSVPYGSSKLIEMINLVRNGASTPSKAAVDLVMPAFAPDLESLSVKDVRNTNEELLRGFNREQGEYTVVTPNDTTKVNLYYRALLADEYRKRGVAEGNPHLYVYMAYGDSWRLVDDERTLEIDVDRYRPQKVLLRVTSGGGSGAKSREYSVTVKSSFKSVERVYYGITREMMEGARDPANINIRTNGEYTYTTGNTSHMQFDCFGDAFGRVQGKPAAKESAFMVTIPFAYYPPDAHDAGEIVHQLGNGLYLTEAIEYKDGEGTISLMNNYIAPIYMEGTEVPEYENMRYVMLRAQHHGETVGELSADILVPNTNTTSFSVTTKEDAVKKYFEEMGDRGLPLWDPRFTYTADSPLVLQPGQNIRVSCWPSIRSYGQFLEYREAHPQFEWEEALHPSGVSAKYYEEEMKSAETLGRPKPYGSYYECPLGFPHDGVDYQFDIAADSRYKPAKANSSKETQELCKLLEDTYAAARQYLQVEGGKGYDMLPEARIQSVKPLPKGVDYLVLTGTTRRTKQKTYMKVACVDGSKIKKPSQLGGSALTVNPKIVFFGDNGASDSLNLMMADYSNTNNMSDFLSYINSSTWGTAYWCSIAQGVMQALNMATDLVKEFYARDGTVWVAWKNLDTKKYSLRYEDKWLDSAVRFESVSDVPYHGFAWFLLAKSTYMTADGTTVPGEFSSLGKSSGRSYPGLVGVFNKGDISKESTVDSFFTNYPELLPIVGRTDNMRPKYGPYAIGVTGTVKDTNVEINNNVVFFCVDRLKDETKNTRMSAMRSAGVMSAAAGGTSGDMHEAKEQPVVDYGEFKFAAVDGRPLIVSRKASSVVTLTADVGGEIESVIPTILNAENISVSVNGGEISDETWNLLKGPEAVTPESAGVETRGAARAQESSAPPSASPQVITVRFDVPEGAVNQAEIVELLVKCKGDDTLYSVAPKGDGPNNGFRVDGMEPVILNGGEGKPGTGGGCSAGAVGWLCLAPLLFWIRKRRGL